LLMYVSLIFLLLGVLSFLVAVEKEFPAYSQAAGTRPNPEGIGNNCVAMGMDLDVSTQQCVPPLGAESTPIPTLTPIPTPTTNQQNIPSQDLNDGGGSSLPNGLSPATSIQTENDTDQLGQASSNETVGWQTYQDTQNGYKIQYPPEWKLDEGITPIKPVLALTPDDETTNILERTEVTVKSTPIEDSRTLDPETLQVKETPFSLEDYAKSNINSFSSIGADLEILENKAVTLNGEPAWSLQFISIDSLGSQVSYSSSIYVIKDKVLFEIDFLTPPLKVPEMRPIGEKIIQSFEFTNSTGP